MATRCNQFSLVSIGQKDSQNTYVRTTDTYTDTLKKVEGYRSVWKFVELNLNFLASVNKLNPYERDATHVENTLVHAASDPTHLWVPQSVALPLDVV